MKPWVENISGCGDKKVMLKGKLILVSLLFIILSNGCIGSTNEDSPITTGPSDEEIWSEYEDKLNSNMVEVNDNALQMSKELDALAVDGKLSHISNSKQYATTILSLVQENIVFCDEAIAKLGIGKYKTYFQTVRAAMQQYEAAFSLYNEALDALIDGEDDVAALKLEQAATYEIQATELIEQANSIF